jgi:hypothetical protein
MADKVEVDVSVRADVAKVSVDDTRVKLTNGEGSVKVNPGNHALTWAVRGAAGTTYAIKITAPDESKMTHSDTFDEDQFDVGLRWFKVNEA